MRNYIMEVQKELKEKYQVSDFRDLYAFYYPGFNLRSTEINAFLGLQQMNIIDDYCNKRQLLLTETQTKQLTDKTKYYRLKNNKLPLPDQILIKPESKVVRKRIFTDICETLTK